VTLTEADLESGNILVNFGRIDDDGWIFVNGKAAAESHEWYASPAYEIRSYLHPGDNTIAVIVKNIGGPGGLSKGVALAIQEKPAAPDWKRSLFNGLAQVIIQAARNDGDIQL